MKADFFDNSSFRTISSCIPQAHLNKLSDLIEKRQVSLNPRKSSIFKGAADERRVSNYAVNDLADEFVQELISLPEIYKNLNSLMGNGWTFTNYRLIKLTRDQLIKDTGFGWHCDYHSFSFLKDPSMGFTLWIPFDVIKAELSNGIDFIDPFVFSGKVLFQLNRLRIAALRRCVSKPAYEMELLRDDYSLIQLERWLDQQTENRQARIPFHRPSFSVGDALFLKSDVVHRTSPALDTVSDSCRQSLIIRFVKNEARFSRKGMNDYVHHLARLRRWYDHFPTTKDPWLARLIKQRPLDGVTIDEIISRSYR